MSSSASRVESVWRRLSSLPGGRWLFARLIGFMVPYSGTVRARFHELEPGRAVLSIRDRRGLRNHLSSIHAVALTNLGELSSGLAMTLALPPGVRGIPIRIDIEFLRKARGTITAHGTADPPSLVEEEADAVAVAELVDESGERVAECRVTWKLRPVE